MDEIVQRIYKLKKFIYGKAFFKIFQMQTLVGMMWTRIALGGGPNLIIIHLKEKNMPKVVLKQ